jgi:hypothetical protein
MVVLHDWAKPVRVAESARATDPVILRNPELVRNMQVPYFYVGEGGKLRKTQKSTMHTL